MIIECSSCRTRYLVQIGLFVQGGRRVRCARCRHEWHVKLPTSIDVFTPAPALPPPQSQSSVDEATAPAAQTPSPAPPIPNLPALIGRWHALFMLKERIKSRLYPIVPIIILIAALIALIVVDGGKIVTMATPALTGVARALGLNAAPAGAGLEFDRVTSSIKYDGGTMRLVVDGVIHNATAETRIVPGIRARALGPDRRIIQGWWIDAPASTIGAGDTIPFHGEVNTSMTQTIESVHLEFYARDEKGDAE